MREKDHVASARDTRLDKMNEELDRVLSACQEIESFKSEIIELRNVVKTLKIRKYQSTTNRIGGNNGICER